MRVPSWLRQRRSTGAMTRSPRYPAVASAGNRDRRRRRRQMGLDGSPLAASRGDDKASAEQAGALPHTDQAKLHPSDVRPLRCIEADAVVDHPNPYSVLGIVEVDSKCMRRRVAGDVAHRLLDDPERSQFDFRYEPHLGAAHLEIHADIVGVLDICEQAPDGGHQPELIQPGRSQPTSHVAKTSDDVEQFETCLPERCSRRSRPGFRAQAFQAAGEVYQSLEWVIVDLVRNVPSLLL